MTVMTAEQLRIPRSRFDDQGTSPKNSLWSKLAQKLRDSTESVPRQGKDTWGGDEPDWENATRPIFEGLMGASVSHFNLLSDLSSYVVEATGAIDPQFVVELNAMAAAVQDIHDHMLNENVLPAFALSFEPVRFNLTFVEPQFIWSEELELDPLDDLD